MEKVKNTLGVFAKLIINCILFLVGLLAFFLIVSDIPDASFFVDVCARLGAVVVLVITVGISRYTAPFMWED